jgi:4-coumarate--CoA ligase
VLAIFSPNNVDTPAVMWGTIWAGGIVTTANSGYTVEELEFQLKDSGAKALVTQLSLIGVAAEAAKRAGIPESNIWILGNDKDTTRKYKHFTNIADISGTNRWRRYKIVPDQDLAFLVYSSGTTGKPKGVKLSHFNVSSNVLQITATDDGTISWKNGPDGDRMMGCLPFFHIYGKAYFRSS